MKTKILVLLVFMGTAHTFAQSKNYSLEDCIRLALENNYDLKSTMLSYETAQVNYR